MRKTAIIALAGAILGAFASTAAPTRAQALEPDAEGWLALDAIGLTIEVPAPFVSYLDPPIVFEDPRGAEIARYPSGVELVRFALASVEAAGETPYAVAAALHEPADEPRLTYEVDRPDLGVVSGYDGAFIFYSGCKRRGERVGCFTLSYPEHYRALVDPAIGRVLRSLR